MGLFDKVKQILFDEEIDEEPIQKENIKEKKKKDKKGFIEYHSEEDTITEVKIPKEEEKTNENVYQRREFNFPFDVEEFSDDSSTQKEEEGINEYIESKIQEEGMRIERPREEYAPLEREVSYRQEVRREEEFDRSKYVANTVIRKPNIEQKDYKRIVSEGVSNEKKPFKVTPIISPVYGVLDKNYVPEKIIEHNPTMEEKDRVRNFGPVSYNDSPLPNINGFKIEKKIEEKETEEEKVKTITTKIETVSPIVEKEELAPDPVIEEVEDDRIISTENYDELVTSGIENQYLGNNNIEDAFESTSEFDTINERDNESKSEVTIDTPVVSEFDEEDKGLDNTIETDLFNLIDSMYKNNDTEEDE